MNDEILKELQKLTKLQDEANLQREKLMRLFEDKLILEIRAIKEELRQNSSNTSN
ncbi:hypothetical protein [Campylobacter fetus]|uniref:hypothetical protein n=1 Tax=Campylobacter fetus TaxID=196 RepID=UPI00073AA955|nr:hypothetical protein [Campylobacter fetus]ALV64630.1 hypothetical protein CFTSP3_0661 [Campylobacter fetus subsp. testudinum Sp3]